MKADADLSNALDANNELLERKHARPVFIKLIEEGEKLFLAGFYALLIEKVPQLSLAHLKSHYDKRRWPWPTQSTRTVPS